MSGLGRAHVDLGMYPFASVAWAWDEIWAAIHERAPWTPGELTRSGDVHARWNDPDCVVTHVCGGPFAAQHRDDMALVGAFDLDLPETHGLPPGRYRTVLLSPHDVALDQLVHDGARAAANSEESLSGWSSLLAATVGPGGTWPGTVTFTSSHAGSLRALAAGDADLASIDSWSLAILADAEPDLIDGLHRVGHGPVVPTPPLTVRRPIDPSRLDELRDAFRDALASDRTATARAALHIRGPVDNSVDDYLETLPLAPRR